MLIKLKTPIQSYLWSVVHFWLVWLKWMRIGLLHVHYTQACTHACMQFARWTMAKFWNFPSLIARLGFIALNANIAPFAIQLLWQTSATITIKGSVCAMSALLFQQSTAILFRPLIQSWKKVQKDIWKRSGQKMKAQPFERSSSFCWRNTQWNMNISSLGGYFQFF